MIDWSRKPRNPSANGASAEPEVAVETGQFVGREGTEVIVLVVAVLVELAVMLVVFMLLVLLAVLIG
jgi:hypothetical protein